MRHYAKGTGRRGASVCALAAMLAFAATIHLAPPAAAQLVAFDPKCRPTTFDDPAVDPRQRTKAHPTPKKPEPACAIRAHMFLAVQQLDWLRMNIDQPSAADRSVAMLQRMQKLLLTLQATPPYTVASKPAAAQAKLMAAYQKCLVRTAGYAEKAEQAVRKREFGTARTFLDRVEAVSHECHLKHAFPKYPGR